MASLASFQPESPAVPVERSRAPHELAQAADQVEDDVGAIRAEGGEERSLLKLVTLPSGAVLVGR